MQINKLFAQIADFARACNPILRFSEWRIARAARRNRALMDAGILTDPNADEFFTIVDGRPMSYRQFNERMAEHFQPADELTATGNVHVPSESHP